MSTTAPAKLADRIVEILRANEGELRGHGGHTRHGKPSAPRLSLEFRLRVQLPELAVQARQALQRLGGANVN